MAAGLGSKRHTNNGVWTPISPGLFPNHGPDLSTLPASNCEKQSTSEERASHRAQQRDTVIDLVGCYSPDAVVCVGVPFGHTRPQWILPYGGEVTVDGADRKVWADFR